jgi:hypothetical protein
MATQMIVIYSRDADGEIVATLPTWTHHVVLDSAGTPLVSQPTPGSFSAVAGATGAYRVAVTLDAGQSLVGLVTAGAQEYAVTPRYADLLDAPTAAEVATAVDAPSAAEIAAAVEAAITIPVPPTPEEIAAEIDDVLSAAHGSGPWLGSSVQVVTSTDGAVAKSPAGLARTVAVGALVEDAIGPLTAGDSHTVTRTVEIVPGGETVAKAWLTIKTDASVLDASAIAQLEITPTDVPGTGHVEDAGASGTAVLRFDLAAGLTRDLVPGRVYDVRVRTSGGRVATVERGRLAVVLSPTRAIA